MQKKLIALAIAGLSSTAFAQSNVTISGVLKGGYDSTKISGGTAATGSMNQFSDQASSFVLSGSEALGNGLSAIFRIDSRFGIDGVDNASNVGTGNTHVGLKSATFGEIKLGTQDLHYNEIERIENGAKSLSQQAMTGRGILSQVGGNNFVGAGTTRTKNVMFWDSPNWSGFTARVAYSTNYSQDELVNVNGANTNTAAVGVDGKQGNSWNAVGRYENGPIKAGVSYLKTEADAAQGAAQFTNKSLRAWGAYKIAGFSLGLAYDNSKQQDFATLGDERKRDGWSVPLSYSVGNHGVYATYAKVSDLETNGVKAGNSGAKQWTLGYSYDLSKRTSVGVNYTKIDNESGASYRFGNNKGATPSAGQDVSQFYAGVRHAF
jgi:predicted porin